MDREKVQELIDEAYRKAYAKATRKPIYEQVRNLEDEVKLLRTRESVVREDAIKRLLIFGNNLVRWAKDTGAPAIFIDSYEYEAKLIRGDSKPTSCQINGDTHICEHGVAHCICENCKK